LESQASNPKPIVELVYDYFYSSFEFNPCDSSQIAFLSISGMKITPVVKMFKCTINEANEYG